MVYRNRKYPVMYRIYHTQCASSKIRGHDQPAYTRDELVEWLVSQAKFHALYDMWVKSGFKLHKPSVDRINNSKGYSMSNIQLTTAEANWKREHNDKKKIVFIGSKQFESVQAAASAYNLSPSSIIYAIKNNKKNMRYGVQGN